MSLFGDWIDEASSSVTKYISGSSSPVDSIAADAAKAAGSTSATSIFKDAINGLLKVVVAPKPTSQIQAPAPQMQIAGLSLPVIFAGLALILILRR